MSRTTPRRAFGAFALAAALALPVTAPSGATADPDPAGVPAAKSAADRPWLDSQLPARTRASLLVDALTLPQKMQQLTGAEPEILPDLPECYGGRHVTGIEELGIPTLRVTNGPVGVGQNDCVDPSLADDPNAPPYAAYSHPSSAKATALPSATSVAASFDPKVAAAFGGVIGTQMRNLGLHVFEAPGMNLARLPVLGRNFEYFGEDPYLSGRMAVAEMRSVQDQGLIGMAKHFVANEQETNRMEIQENIDERTLHELYLLPFEMAVKDGDASAVMCAYNYVNGVSSCENEYILEDVLREQWDFKGYVQSDFFATKSTVGTLLNGMDHMMPTPQQWAPARLGAALDAGQIEVADIDRALERRYVQMFEAGIFERPLEQTPIDHAAGGRKAHRIGTQGAVLLQNNGALPIEEDVDDVLVIGKKSQVYAQQAVAGGSMVGQPMGAGGGSSDVVPTYTVSPVAGIRNALKRAGSSGSKVSLALVDDQNRTATRDGTTVPFEQLLGQARKADAVVMMAGTIAEEGADRATFTDPSGTTRVGLGNNLDWYSAEPKTIATDDGPNPARNSHTVDMVKRVMDASPRMAEKTTLVLKDNAGVAMDRALVGRDGPAILESWFPGQEDGNIVGDLLLGLANPSGKSPVTFPYAGRGFLDDLDSRQFPGDMVDGEQTVDYSERLNIGYRWYDANAGGDCAARANGANPCVAFPFGHGLSYTDFELSGLRVTPRVTAGRTPITVRFTLRNTGRVAGAEAPQVYLGLPRSAGEPPRRLVGFDKVRLGPGESRRMRVRIDPAAANHPMSWWDSDADRWRVATGRHTVYVGRSSGDTPLRETVRVLGRR